MPTYNVTDPDTKQSVKLTGDSPPTEQELIEIFGSIKKPDDTPEWATQQGALGTLGPTAYGLYGAGKSMLETGAEMYAMGRGAKVGGALGGRLPGRALGSGLGYMAAKGVESKLEDPLKALSGGDIATNTALGTGMQLAGEGVMKILSPLAKRITPAIKNLEQKAKDIFGITLSPAEVTQNKTLSLWESLMDKSPFSATEISNWRELNQLKPLLKARDELLAKSGNPQSVNALGGKIKTEVDGFLKLKGIVGEQKLNVARDSVLRKLGSSDTTEDLVTPVQELLAKRSQEAVAKKNDIFTAIGDMIPEGKGTAKGLGNQAEKYLSEISKLPNQDKTLLNLLSWASKKTDPSPEALQLLAQIKGMPKQIQDATIKNAQKEGVEFGGDLIPKEWPTLQKLRIQLNDLIKGEDLSVKMGNPGLKGQTSYEGSVYKNLKAILDKDMENIAEKAGSGAYDQMKIANAFFADEYAPIWKDSKLIKQLAYKKPEEVVNVVFKPTNIQEIRKLKSALGQGGFDNLKKSFTNKLLQSDVDATFKPQTLEKNIAKYGNEFLNEVYPPNEINILKSLAQRRLDTQVIGGTFLKSIAEGNPEVIVDSILGTMQRTSSEKTLLNNVLNIKRAVNPATMDDIKYQLAERLFQPNVLTDFVGPETMSRSVGRYANTLGILYTPEQVKWLHLIQNVGKRMVSAEKLAQNPSGTAQNIIAYGTFGALINPLLKGEFGQFLAGVGSSVMAPKYMTKIYFSRLGRKYFTEGLVTKPNTKRGIEITTKLLGILSQDED